MSANSIFKLFDPPRLFSSDFLAKQLLAITNPHKSKREVFGSVEKQRNITVTLRAKSNIYTKVKIATSNSLQKKLPFCSSPKKLFFFYFMKFWRCSSFAEIISHSFLPACCQAVLLQHRTFGTIELGRQNLSPLLPNRHRKTSFLGTLQF